MVDAGDVVLNPHDPSTIFDAIYHHAKHIIATDTKMLSFGGDHFVAYPLLKAHAEAYGPIALLQFDAHSDTWDSFGPLDHGTMFYEAVKEGLIDVEHSIQVGFARIMIVMWACKLSQHPIFIAKALMRLST